jgi:hypothetical protein
MDQKFEQAVRWDSFSLLVQLGHKFDANLDGTE